MSEHSLLFPELHLASGELQDSPKLWSTGVFPSQKIEEFVASGWFRAGAPITEVPIQPACLDVRLGP
ncbi:MAG: 2'-deoxycytidine 5'-triphosphate deaminase domain-containing protein, partial [Terriglobia bacterium]